MKQFVIILASALMLISCGGESGEITDSTVDESKKSTLQEKVQNEEAPSAITITIEGNDDMKYNKDLIIVQANQEVTLVLKHVGKMEKAAMGHNWTLLKKGVDMSEFAVEAIGANDNNYIPKGTNKVIAHTEMIGGGEETSVTFKAPARGSYQFLCTFPGHYGSMNGKFTVE